MNEIIDLPPLRLAVFGFFPPDVHSGFGTASEVLRKLWIFSVLVNMATGRQLEAVDDLLPIEAQLADADILLIACMGPREAAVDVARRFRNSSVTIFVCGENTARGPGTLGGEFHDHLAGEVRIIMGERDLSSSYPESIRLPWWIPDTLTRECGCTFPPQFRAREDPQAWGSRPGFASFLASRAPFPRPELFRLLSSLGHGMVDSPGQAFHNIEWPGPHVNYSLGNSIRGKVDFMRQYKFALCTENSMSVEGRGYNTEKLPHALESGAVPIYWGDTFIDPVFNQKRYIFATMGLTRLPSHSL